MRPFISIQAAALGCGDSATERSSRGSTGLGFRGRGFWLFVMQIPLLGEDHQRCGTQTHTDVRTVCWFVGLPGWASCCGAAAPTFQTARTGQQLLYLGSVRWPIQPKILHRTQGKSKFPLKLSLRDKARSYRHPGVAKGWSHCSSASRGASWGGPLGEMFRACPTWRRPRADTVEDDMPPPPRRAGRGS